MLGFLNCLISAVYLLIFYKLQFRIVRYAMVFKVDDFDWTAKLVASVDCSTSTLNPLIQLKLHSNESKSTKIFEFTKEELLSFISQL